MVMQKLFKHMGPEGGSSAPQVCRQLHHQASQLMLPGDSTHRFAKELICDIEAEVTQAAVLMSG